MKKIILLFFLIVELHLSGQTVFGSASFGGSNGYGALYSCDSKTGKISFLHNFNQAEGVYPNGVYADKSGVIYGTTQTGGKYKLGTIFEYIPSAKYFSVLHSFDSLIDSGQPVGCITRFSDGKFYGLVDPIKKTPGFGRLFKFDPLSNKDSICFTFNGPNGKYGTSNLIQASNSLLYGVTSSGGKYNYGVLFSYNIVTGKDSVVIDFDSITNGSNPWSYFIQAANGLLYGFTNKGGSHNKGVLLSYNPITGKDSVLIQFNGKNGAYPYASPIIGPNGMLYGTTDSGGISGKGVLFSYNITTGKDSILVNFYGGNGNIPTYIVVDSINNIFGGSWSGGLNNDGVFYRYNVLTHKDSIIYSFGSTTGVSLFGPLAIFKTLQDTLSGRVFVDTKNNCTYTSTDKNLEGITIYAVGQLGDTVKSVTDTSGRYSLVAAQGYKYTTHINISGFTGFSAHCPASQIYIDSLAASNNDFSLYDTVKISGVTLTDSLWFNCYHDTTEYYQFILQGSLTGLSNGDTVTEYVIYGDGSEDSLTIISKSNSRLNISQPFVHLYDTTGVLTYKGIIKGPGGISGMTAPSMVTVIDSCAVIMGVAYYDYNNNCIYDKGDSGVSGIYIHLYDTGVGQQTTTTDYYGHYSFYNLNKGQHYQITIDTLNSPEFSISCPASGLVYATPNTPHVNLALACLPGYDLTTTNVQFCLGQEPSPDTNRYMLTLNMCFNNLRCTPVNAMFRMVYDSVLTPPLGGSSYVGQLPSNISGDTVTWSFNNLTSTSSTVSTCIQTFYGSAYPVHTGDSIWIEFISLPVTGDSVPANNHLIYWIRANGLHCSSPGLPYDPNEKSVFPMGPVKASQKLTYTIRFQNIGSGPANNVFVYDTLSPYLDPSTFTVVSSSAPVTTNILAGNIAQFSFTGINLPDELSTETGSKGYITYTVMPMNNDIVGTNIKNRASIYFDNNPQILTNTISSIIDTAITAGVNKVINSDLHLACFPNPFQLSTTVLFNKDGKHSLEIDDITGRKIKAIKCIGKQYILLRDGLVSGVYIIKATEDGYSYIFTSKLVVQ